MAYRLYQDDRVCRRLYRRFQVRFDSSNVQTFCDTGTQLYRDITIDMGSVDDIEPIPTFA